MVEYKVIAETYRNREHSLLKQLISLLDTEGDTTILADSIKQVVKDHLASTGRHWGSALDTPPLSEMDDFTKQQLLGLLGGFEGQTAPIPQVKYNKDGTPRKQRSDKGKKRGKRKER